MGRLLVTEVKVTVQDSGILTSPGIVTGLVAGAVGRAGRSWLGLRVIPFAAPWLLTGTA